MLGFLWRAIREAFQKDSTHIDPPGDDEESLDPFNPFPTPVVIEFSDTIDLHSIPPRQIKTVVEEFLQEAHRRRVRWLRIIHGRGISVQRETVRAILARTPFVVEFKDAPPEAGGWGATIVTLGESDEDRKE